MAARRPVLCALALAAVMALMFVGTAAPGFAGLSQAAPRQPRVAARARTYEIFVTQPSVGERTRMSVTKDTTCDEIIHEGRRLLGFDQAWIPDSDFKLYLKEDESTPITGTMGNHNVRPWGPDGLEVHLMFEPSE
uniref:Uncharacterized protein n=1 Tax=Alexandrium catenella TaxID=2925 RepID=A0A7S1RUH9_ALECA|mmetsp:Transcript_72953/g.193783  ORF Transcript_72953/g.193783 Transcript_72953/m.193783 type:complete len:135 (+) Transcript_72953:97-501(+)